MAQAHAVLRLIRLWPVHWYACLKPSVGTLAKARVHSKREGCFAERISGAAITVAHFVKPSSAKIVIHF